MQTLKKDWPQTEVLGIAVDCLNREQLLDFLLQQVRHKASALNTPPATQVVTMNAEMAYAASLDAELMQILQEAEIVIPDGIGVVWALRHQGVPMQRLPGVEVVEELFARAATEHLRIAIWGSHPDTLAELQTVLKTRFQAPELVFCQHGYYAPEEEEALLAQLAATEVDILFVALGVPRQEQWIQRWREHLKIPVMMGVGGSFDVISGRLQRAPLWMRQSHLEWLYRLYQQPSRWRRMLALPKFVMKVLST